MGVGTNDIILDQVCGKCYAAVMVPIQDGWPLVVMHLDAELEADHAVTKLKTPPKRHLNPMVNESQSR